MADTSTDGMAGSGLIAVTKKPSGSYPRAVIHDQRKPVRWVKLTVNAAVISFFDIEEIFHEELLQPIKETRI